MRRFLLLLLPIMLLAVAAAVDIIQRIRWNWMDEHILLISIVLGSILVVFVGIVFYSAIRINHNREDDCLTPPPGGDSWKRGSKT